MTHQVKRYHDISCGHRVHGHEGKCAHLHGHNYRIHFVCESFEMAPLDAIGRVIDFGVLKEKLCMWLEEHWDHKFLVWEKDPLANYLWELDKDGVVKVPFNPTAENMAEYLVRVVASEQLKETDVVLVECTIEETRKCSVTFKE